ncbi:6-phosphofructokinase [Acholeplasma laidlawii]|uniref:6-phosphofructokinase n=1 Tax=Acholeplasma laidlawii TaxID=2148 RepID=UPI0025422930|nr:6-phosphofructokinase [Acholeplasma laidlawii]
MKKLVGAALLGQSGGPTSVINASAAGVFLESLKHDEITEIYGAQHGIKGILDENFYDIRKEDVEELERLKYTPSSAIGSVRYKLKDYKKDPTDYNKLLEIFKKYNIRYFFYNGGNDSMDTCLKISKFMKTAGWEMRVVGVPKTIDNDLAGIDHSPGYGSAAKYVATSIMELYLDATVYNTQQFIIVEVMGRNAGWLTAAAALASVGGVKPDLMYLPETPFDMDKFYNQVGDLLKTGKSVFVVVSEGIKTAEGKYIPEYETEIARDAFGHANLGGTASVLANHVGEKFGVKTRAIEFSLLQRSAAHIASQTDINEAFKVGQIAVKKAINGTTNKFVGIQRVPGDKYKVKYPLLPLKIVANAERKVPLEWILPDGKGLTQDFIDYALPLIQGETKLEKVNGLPRFAKLNKVLAPKK